MSENADKYFVKALTWLFIATIIAFTGDFIEGYFDNNEIIVGISDTISLIVWVVFVYYVIAFYKNKKIQNKYKPAQVVM